MATIVKQHQKTGVRYKAIIRRKGAPHRSKTFRTRSQAERWARKMDAAVDDRRTLPTARAEGKTVADLISKYRDQIVPTYPPQGQTERQLHLTWWEQEIGDVRLLELRRHHAESALNRLTQGRSPSGKPLSPSTRNRYLSTLRHAVGIASRRWDWLPFNPLTGLQVREPRGRTRFFGQHDEQEIARLLRACQASSSERLYPLVLCALSSGARQGELLGLRREHVDLDQGIALVTKTKNEEPKLLHFTGAALDRLRDFLDGVAPRRYVFGASDRVRPAFPRAAWEHALERAGLVDFRFHDLRHTAASWAAMSGASDREIGELLGHKDPAMVRRYSHLRRDHMRGVSQRLMDRLVPAPASQEAEGGPR